MMEIWTYLWSRRGRIAVLTLLPIVVSLGTAYYVAATEGPRVEGALELALPGGSSSGIVSTEIANFISVVQGGSVRRGLSEKFNIPPEEIESNLGAARVDSDGTYVRVVYVTDSLTDLGAIVTTAAEQAVSSLLDPQIDATGAAREALLTQYAAVGDDPTFETLLVPQGLNARQLIQRKQDIILHQVSELDQQIGLLTAQRTAAQAAASDRAAVTITTTSANAIVARTTIVNAGLAFFAAIVLLIAWDTVRPRRGTPSGTGRRGPWNHTDNSGGTPGQSTPNRNEGGRAI